MTQTPKFFITHSWKDIDFTKRLFDDLRANGLDGFFDAYSVKPGDDIAARIAKGLEECDVYVPILSPVALKSPWCEREINAAINLSMEPGRGERPRIIPVLAEKCSVPVLLRPLLYINFAGRYDDGLNELLTKGFGLKPTVAPTSPIPPVRFSVPPAPSSPTLNSPRTWLVAGGGVVAVLGLCLLMAWAIGQLGVVSTQTPTRVAQVAISLVIPTNTAVLTARPTSAPTLTPTNVPTTTPIPPTRIPTLLPTPTLGIGATKISADGATMVYVPAGDFLMGSSDKDIANALSLCSTCNFDDEKPSHTVYLDAFWIDKFEVTNALYKKCVDAKQCQPPNQTKSYTRDSYYGNAQYDNYPVIYVLWEDASKYCTWAKKNLPTEAQWEKAARGTDSRIYPWGNSFDKNALNSSEGGKGDTTVVGSFASGASPYGAMDMAGNVWEWAADWYDANYYKNSPARNPTGPTSGQSSRVVRGGAWYVDANLVRAANRNLNNNPDSRNYNIGFRCAE